MSIAKNGNEEKECPPVDVEVFADNIPLVICRRPQWVCWRWTWKQSKQKWDKPPFDAQTGRHASSTDLNTWATFDEALAAYRDPAKGYSGIGYVFSGQPGDYVGIDLDHCRDPKSGTIQAWTDEQLATGKWTNAPDPQQIIDALGTYAEISPSQTGVKLLAKGDLQRGGKAGDFEAYRVGRYFTVTGHSLTQPPSNIADCNGVLSILERGFFARRARKPPAASKPKPRGSTQASPSHTVGEVIQGCRRATNSAKFERLWAGDTAGYPSQSEAELALCGLVAFYAGLDERLIDDVVRRSGLYREKWDEVHSSDGQTYGQMTIAKALDGKTDFYQSTNGQVINIGDIELKVKQTKRTPGKVTVSVEIHKTGDVIDVIRMSDAASNRQDAVKRIAKLAQGNKDAAEEAVSQILVQAHRGTLPGSDSARDLPTVREILKQHVVPTLKLIYRTVSGKAFSEVLEDEISRSNFIEHFTSNALMDLCYAAGDAPMDDEGVVQRGALQKVIIRELQLLWGDLIGGLPPEDGAELSDKSFAAREFRATILKVWSKPSNMGIHKYEVNSGPGPRDSVQLASRTSLASRVNRMCREILARGKWHRIQEGYDAWMRVEEEEVGVGELVPRIYLAMRWTLADQIGVKLPEINSQKQLSARGRKYGAFIRKPKIADVTSGGTARLVLLVPRLVQFLLDNPEDDDVANQSE